MITGVHALLHGPDAEATRAFFRDVLGFRSVDAGGGWPIFALPPGEVAMHPADAPKHELYLMCEDLDATIAELRARGARFDGEPQVARWGRFTRIALPGGGSLGLYQPTHPTAIDRPVA